MSLLADSERQKAFAEAVMLAFRQTWEGQPIQVGSLKSSLLPVMEMNSAAHVEKVYVLEVKLVVREREARLVVAPMARVPAPVIT